MLRRSPGQCKIISIGDVAMPLDIVRLEGSSQPLGAENVYQCKQGDTLITPHSTLSSSIVSRLVTEQELHSVFSS